ncbi:conserved hypothetical protein [Leifsonia xyli subsp. xyli str. CTCB07]|uniref:Orc1-like AAA ATPase domain-containing protein n=1 Tax=Leifsonia xyli subsp. xyli (strain CTCB07) TaxID=281090 RepID=Q6AEI9_LEIXX|nr:ATP-binding protein [Leifsonia xyli]AAT89207.1 conserved hypothetical protein [Leifsonia xyli subsp. xyli str. CTCB07]
MSDATYDPYRPGAGRVPPLLAGRENLLAQFDTTLVQATGTGEGPRPQVLFGLRGVGKTSLLNEFVLRAREQRWLIVKIEATPDRSLGKAIAQALYRPLRDMRTLTERGQDFVQRAMRVFTSFQLRFDPQGNATFGFNIEPERGVADTGELPADLVDVLTAIGTAARENGIALLLAIDELQDAPLEDLRTLNVALHELGQDPFPVPVVFVGAGLPSLPAVLADATSYAERLYDYRFIGLLDEQDTRDAFTVPARAQGVYWNDDALDAVVEHAAGYPYFVQVAGHYSWEGRSGARIPLKAATDGIAKAQREVDEGLYRSRWERSTPAQREFMAAMVVDEGRPSSIADLVVRLGRRRSSDLSVARRDLIAAGHIFAPERGYVAFTVPDMDDYIRRQPEV